MYEVHQNIYSLKIKKKQSLFAQFIYSAQWAMLRQVGLALNWNIKERMKDNGKVKK